MIKKLWKYTEDARRETILTPVFVALECIMELIVPFLMGKFVDNGVDKADSSYMVRMGLVILASILISLLFGVLSSRFSAIGSCGFAKSIRQAEFERVQTFSFGNIDKFSTSSLITRMTTDIGNMQMAFMMLTRMAVRAPLNVGLSAVMVFILCPRLAWVFLISIPIIVFATIKLSGKAHPLFERMFKIYDRLNRVVQENVRGIRVVKSYVRDENERAKFEKTTENIYDINSLAERILSWQHPILQLCISMSRLLICYLGGRMIVLGTLSSGTLMSLISYTISSLMALDMLSMLWVTIIMSRASAERIVEVLEENTTIENGPNPVMQVKDGSIRFEKASFAYREGKDCLHELTVDIPAGATVGILGGTGSGKSSMAQLIPRLYDTTEGSVYVGGVDVRDYDLATLREEVAMVLQKNVLFEGTIRSNMLWGDENATDAQIEHACRQAQAHEFITKLAKGYDAPVDQGGTNFSGGQKQRLCIARALLKKPKILILDDSTSAVDTATDALIRKAFMEEIPNTTKLIIAQRISSVVDADMIIVMDDGRIVDHGKHAELLERCTIYREVYESQQKGVGQLAG